MNIELKSSGKIVGELCVPGDKSVSHRSVMLGSLASGTTRITNFLMSDDCLRTLKCFKEMGVKAKWDKDGALIIHGAGEYGLVEPRRILNAGNSGSTLRMMAGILAGQKFKSFFTGDASLSSRPMGRVILPLKKMGAQILAREDNYLPLAINGKQLKGISYEMPISSAQVKSALIFAGLFAIGKTTVIEPGASRDHTERILAYFGHPLVIETGAQNNPSTIITIEPLNGKILKGREIAVPGDISSAAFFLALALIVPGSEITVKDVGMNPGRTGILDILKKMKADLKITNRRRFGNEPVADITAKYSNLKATDIGGDIIPKLIDELPLLAMLASQADGVTVISGAKELRVKESDRIASTVAGLKAMGAAAEETDDGMIIRGSSKLKGALINSYHDHRIAMTFAVAAHAAKGATTILKAESVSISYPGFFEQLSALKKGIAK